MRIFSRTYIHTDRETDVCLDFTSRQAGRQAGRQAFNRATGNMQAQWLTWRETRIWKNAAM